MAEPLELLLKRFSFFENLCFFAIFTSPARPSAEFGLVDLRKLVVFCDSNRSRDPAEFRAVDLLSLWRGAHFDEAARPKPLPSQWDLHQLRARNHRQAMGLASEALLTQHQRAAQLSAASAAQLASSNSCCETFYSKTLLSKLFLSTSKILWLIVCD